LAVDTDEVTGDHGRDDANELLDRLRGPLIDDGMGGTGGASAWARAYNPYADGRLDGDGFMVRMDSSILVEAFHGGFVPFIVPFVGSLERLDKDGDESGVRLCE
jgi:hypothetical protein